MARALMVMGTASHVGKTLMVAALCRILRQDGYRVAPFKAQNMSRNAALTADGRELSRAQAMQAEAAGVPPDVHMNPLLLKPTNAHAAQLIVQGRAVSEVQARQYMADPKHDLWTAVVDSYRALDRQFDVLVIEGAGSPVEMNLKDRDLANMRVAALAQAPVMLVADIERGGVFAAVVGTLSLLAPEERQRVRGVVINKFRGDPTLFDDGVRLLEERTQTPVWGVVPYIPDLWLDEEDSMGLEADRYRRAARGDVRVAIVLLPHIANFTDFDALFWDPSVDAAFVRRPEALADADAVILPGTKNTLDDLAWLRAAGWLRALEEARTRGAAILGICGGFQMLGRAVRDPERLESSREVVEGLGWMTMDTTLRSPKRTTWVSGRLAGAWGGIPVAGYEMHMGQSRWQGSRPAPLAEVKGPGEVAWRDEGAVLDAGAVIGTYLHGIFDDGGFRDWWLQLVRRRRGMSAAPRPALPMAAVKEEAYDRLAAVVRAHLAMPAIYRALAVEPRGAGPIIEKTLGEYRKG